MFYHNCKVYFSILIVISRSKRPTAMKITPLLVSQLFSHYASAQRHLKNVNTRHYLHYHKQNKKESVFA